MLAGPAGSPRRTRPRITIRKSYRFLTGPDDAGFCQKVRHAVTEGYVLYGDSVMASCNGEIVCGQAVILPGIIPGVQKDEAGGEDD